MPYPASIDSLTSAADIVAKVKVLAVTALPSDKNSPLANDFWKVCRAKLKYISVLKGGVTDDQSDFLFRSGTPVEKQPVMWINVGPDNFPHFKLEVGRTYILFIKRSNGKLTQIASQFGLRSWEGFFEAADDSVVPRGRNPKQTVWDELAKLVHGKAPDKNSHNSQEHAGQQYAALTLLNLSAGSKGVNAGSDDFDRATVVDEIFAKDKRPLAASRNAESLRNILAELGSNSPYLNESTRMRFLWSRASKPISSWSAWDLGSNSGIKPAIPFLLEVADGDYPADVRAAAINCLGNCQTDAKSASLISLNIERWLRSPIARVRAAAALLLVDYPSQDWLNKILHDREPLVRASGAYCVGVTHSEQWISQLSKMLNDDSAEVQVAAALSLIAFPVDKVKSILVANLKNANFGSGFLARVGYADPAAVKDQLLNECRKPDPMHSPGGLTQQFIAFQNGLATSPHALCLNALIKYLDGLSGLELSKSEYAKYLDEIEKIGAVDPSQTGKVYEVLVTHRLVSRASAFKQRALASQPSLPLIAFEQVDREMQSGSLKMK
ncbi:MAG: HEAT repeat domain-containing protein [Candidatus Obscuribacterales bacterium]